MCYVGDCYRDGEGVDKNLKKAMDWYRRAYDLHKTGAGKAANEIGLIYSSEENDEEAFVWYSKGAEEGNEWAMYNLAEMYREGEGVSEDPDKAMKWYKKAYACHGEAAGDAANWIGRLYYLAGNENEAFRWNFTGAQDGSEEAMYDLAGLYLSDGVAENQNEAMEWYEKIYHLHGERAGEAANYIGVLYGDYKKDPKMAFIWFLRGAIEGFDCAMANLGNLYEAGRVSRGMWIKR